MLINVQPNVIGVNFTAKNAIFVLATVTQTTVRAGDRKIFDVFGGLAKTRRGYFNLIEHSWSKTRHKHADTTMVTQFMFPRIVAASKTKFFPPCSATSRNPWNHVMWTFERLSSAHIHLDHTRVSVSVGGQLERDWTAKC